MTGYTHFYETLISLILFRRMLFLLKLGSLQYAIMKTALSVFSVVLWTNGIFDPTNVCKVVTQCMHTIKISCMKMWSQNSKIETRLLSVTWMVCAWVRLTQKNIKRVYYSILTHTTQVAATNSAQRPARQKMPPDDPVKNYTA